MNKEIDWHGLPVALKASESRALQNETWNRAVRETMAEFTGAWFPLQKPLPVGWGERDALV